MSFLIAYNDEYKQSKTNDMKEHLQVKIFDNVTGDNTTECNDFLKDIGTRVKDIKTEYNTILGGVVYIVTYWC
jgi:hypothetical protein